MMGAPGIDKMQTLTKAGYRPGVMGEAKPGDLMVRGLSYIHFSKEWTDEHFPDYSDRSQVEEHMNIMRVVRVLTLRGQEEDPDVFEDEDDIINTVMLITLEMISTTLPGIEPGAMFNLTMGSTHDCALFTPEVNR